MSETWTIPDLVRDWAAQRADHVALREKKFGIWQDITWGEYWEQIQLVAHGLADLGVDVGDRVAIHAENRSEWLFADLGTMALGAITVGLYPTNPPAEVEYLLQDSGTRVLIAEDQEQVDKALAVEANLPDLEWIVHIEPRGVRGYDHPKLISWEHLLERGRAHRDADPGLLDRARERIDSDTLVTLVYTSGTTGPPKGAMLSVANVRYVIEKIIPNGELFEMPVGPTDMTLSYLPLCHVAERLFTTWVQVAGGNIVHFAESIETVTVNLREVQPTIFFAVPRIWEKLHAGIQVRMYAASRLKRWLYALSMRIADRVSDTLVANGGRHTSGSRTLAAIGWVLMFRALRDRIGLRRCRIAFSAAAPIAPELLRWFMGIGVPILEAYGMTENSAVATVNRPGRVAVGTVGEPYSIIELRLDDETHEVLTRHPGTFVGYWNKPDMTAQTIDADGWLHTGDVGEWAEDGTHLKIVDRMKDIIITAGGKNISPSEIENSVKTSPFIREAVVIGDQQPYLVALIGIELDTVADWATRKAIPFTTYRDLSEKPQVLRLVQSVIAETNEKFARVENLRKFRMITKELDHEDGELTATQKVKRAALYNMFGDLIEDMYGNGTRFAGGDQKDVHTPAEAETEVAAS